MRAKMPTPVRERILCKSCLEVITDNAYEEYCGECGDEKLHGKIAPCRSVTFLGCGPSWSLDDDRDAWVSAPDSGD